MAAGAHVRKRLRTYDQVVPPQFAMVDSSA
jgi:hypothetical protein